MKLGDVMDEVAERIRQAPSLAGRRTFAYPPGTVSPPAAIVDYPSEGTFDATYGRGSDTVTGQVAVLIGNPTERQTRDLLTKYIDGSGPESLKALIDGDDYASCDFVRVASWETEVWTVAGVDYLTALFSLQITGPGEG